MTEYTQEFTEGFVIPFIKKLGDMQKEKGGRVIAFLAAPPAAGKSSLAAYMESVSRDDPSLPYVQALGMDGFHMKQKYLKTHYIMKEGQEIPLSSIKGAPETFDLEGLTRALQRMRDGASFGFPAYSRRIHDTVDNALTVSANIVLVEGNYLLLNREGWRELKQLSDISVFIRTEPEYLSERLVRRKLRAGWSLERAKSFVEASDLANARLILSESLPADITLYMDKDGEYRVI